MLRVNRLNVFYEKIQVLWDVSVEVKPGEIVALIGANSAGKTTLMKTIAGIRQAASGEITYQNQSIIGMRSNRIVEKGISLIPEGRKLFGKMSVIENLEMGAYLPMAWKRKDETLEQVFKIFPVLKDRQNQQTRYMSGGQQQMVAMARGLMSRPKLCLIDEPSCGLAPMIVKEMFDEIRDLRDQGISIFLVEQNVQKTLEIADRAYVLENGRVVLEGDSRQLLKEDLIKKAYLGL
jgi:branched-chain amino acid transport system ATP-binding protein